MITRRSFLSALAALPVIGRLAPEHPQSIFYTQEMPLSEVQAWYNAGTSPIPFDPQDFTVPTMEEVQSHYNATYGHSTMAPHPRFRADIDKLANKLRLPPAPL